VTALPILILIFNILVSSGISTLTPNTPLKGQLAFIKKLMQEFPDEMIVNRVEGPTLRSFHKLLSALDSLEQWGLDKVPTSEGELWLCEEHAKEYK